MDVHSAPVSAKRMWGYLRAVFLMVRKSVVSKRKLLVVGMHLVTKRRRNNAVANLLSRHGEYEFSCRRAGMDSSRRRPLAYFPCLGADDEPAALRAAPAPALHRIEYYASAPSSPGLLMQDLGAMGDDEEDMPPSSPLVPTTSGAFSVRVSDFSAEEDGGLGNEAVDDEAEEFIARFYDQLRRQNHVGLQLPY